MPLENVGMWRDIKHGFRQLRGKKLFGITIILLLTLGIGSNTVIFSFVNSLLLRRLPVRVPENLYLLQKERPRQVRSDTSFFWQQFEAVDRRRTIFSAAVAEQAWAGNSFEAFSRGHTVRLIATQIVSPNYFSELGVKAVAGRVLTAADATGSSTIPVVLSYQFWSSQFNQSFDILNRTIRVKNYPFLVVGVLPRGFPGIDADRVPDVRFPISAALPLTGSSVAEPSGDYPIGFQILTRLAPGVSGRQASAAILPVVDEMEEPLWRNWYARSSKPFPPSDLPDEIKWWRTYRIALFPASHGVSELRAQFSHVVVLLMGAAGLLLLGVCANVAGLLLARSEERKREVAIRLSVGATRWRLLRQLSVENALLAIPSAILGVGLAYALSPWLLKLLPSLGIGPYAPPVALDVTPDARVLLFAVAACLLTVFLFGMAPARRALKVDLNEQLKAYSRGFAAAGSGTATVAI
ncbi:MAG: ABC transporter permease [Acidobacteriota bacterium]|nr:ABC transporter permease [Acidobacteriota bacterium]